MITRRTKQRACRPVVCAIVMLLPLLKVNMIELDSQIEYLLGSYECHRAAQQVQQDIDNKQSTLSSSALESILSTWLMLYPAPLQVTLDTRPQFWAKYERLTQAMIDNIRRLVCEV